jgi:hypothetical protein
MILTKNKKFSWCFFVLKRSLYPQLTSIYDCVSDDDHESIRRILSTPTNTEQRVICTWNLPRGKRPSRTHTESKVNRIKTKIQQKSNFIFLANVNDRSFLFY